jgi:hypothetical protein
MAPVKTENGASAPSGMGVVGVQRWAMVVLMSHARPAVLPRVTSIPASGHTPGTWKVLALGTAKSTAALRARKTKRRDPEIAPFDHVGGGRYRVRTCDPYHVKVVLYR